MTIDIQMIAQKEIGDLASQCLEHNSNVIICRKRKLMPIYQQLVFWTNDYESRCHFIFYALTT